MEKKIERMTYTQFKYAIHNLKEFFKEQEKLDAVCKVISPTSTGVVEFGNKFIDHYIDVVEIALGDNGCSVSWFVFENEFGKNKLRVKVGGKETKVCNSMDMYRVITTQTPPTGQRAEGNE